MFVEEFLKSDGKLARLNQALSILSEIGFFEVLIELSHKRSGQLPMTNISEAATLQRGFGAGYFEAIEDIYHFRDRVRRVTNEEIKTNPDWGATKYLLSKGWTEKDIEDARKQRSNSK